MYLKELENKIKNDCFEEAKDMIKEIGKNKKSEAVPLLIHHLISTDNNSLRNTIAMALADIGSAESIEPLISLLRSPKTVGARGTLLYALGNFNCASHAELIAEMLCEDNFELSRQSLLLLESNAKDIPFENKLKCNQIINDKIERLCDQVEFLNYSLKVLKK